MCPQNGEEVEVKKVLSESRISLSAFPVASTERIAAGTTNRPNGRNLCDQRQGTWCVSFRLQGSEERIAETQRPFFILFLPFIPEVFQHCRKRKQQEEAERKQKATEEEERRRRRKEKELEAERRRKEEEEKRVAKLKEREEDRKRQEGLFVRRKEDERNEKVGRFPVG
jgi:hypothetical protein